MSNVNRSSDPVYGSLLEGGWSWRSSCNTFTAKYGVTTLSEIAAACNAGKTILAIRPEFKDVFYFNYLQTNGNAPVKAYFNNVFSENGEDPKCYTVTVDASGWANEYITLPKKSDTIFRSDTIVQNANEHLSNSYIKTGKDFTENLPSEVYGTSSEWGVLFFIAENTEELTGTQIFYPIDGPYKGRMFIRSLVHMSYETPDVGEWSLVAMAST